jgi:hypothetical protein
MRWLQLLAVLVVVSLFACDNNSNDLLAPAPSKGPLASIGIDPVSGASIETDQDDYVPGQIVHVTGRGWAANETVHLFMTEDPDTHGDVEQDAVADSAGGFSLHFYDVQEHDLGVTFTLTATGATSGSSATAVFMDSRTVNAYTLNSTTFTFPASPPNSPATNPITVPAGSSVSVAASVTTNGTAGGTGNGSSLWLSTSVEVKLNPSGAFNQILCDETDVNTGGAGTFSSTFSFVAPSVAGTYDVRVRAWAANNCAGNNGDKTYSGAMVVTASKTTPTITWANPAAIVYGTALSGTQLNATASVAGSFSYTPAAGTVLNAGSGQTLHADFTPTDGTLYNTASKDVSIDVLRANATIHVSGYTGVYDGFAHGASGTATGVGGVDLSADLNLGATFTDVPGGTATWTFAGNTNYNAAGDSVSITITKATAVLSVDGYSGEYDGIAHGATGSATGVTGEDLNSLFLSLGATFMHVPGGSAHWTFAGNQNYRDSSGTVSIVIAPLAVAATIAAADKVYNGGDAATITDCTLQGALAGDDVSCSASGATFANANAGSNKTVTATVALTGTASGDYTLGVSTTVTTMASISQKSVTATITAADKTYDGTASADITTCTVNGTVGSDDVHCSTSSAVFSSVGAGDDKPVSATVSLSGSASGNYTLDDNTTASTTATIHKAPLTVTADDQQKTYDGAGYSPFTATFTGFVNGEGVSELSGSPEVGGNAVGAVNAGSYTITPYLGSLTAANYAFAKFNSGTLTIDKAPLTVTADNKAKVFDGTPYSSFTATLTGFVNGEPASVVTGAAGFTGAAVGAMMPGSYAITPTAGTLTATNYAFTTFHNGTLTIIAWTLTGFYQPVDMPTPTAPIIWNTVKGGSTVPLKFEIFAGSIERNDVGSVKSFTQAKVACDASSPLDDVEVTTTGGTSLRYDGTAGQFIQNWQTPKLAGQCYRVTMTTQDDSKLVTFFKLK